MELINIHLVHLNSSVEGGKTVIFSLNITYNAKKGEILDTQLNVNISLLLSVPTFLKHLHTSLRISYISWSIFS